MKRRACLVVFFTLFLTAGAVLSAKNLEINVPDGMTQSEEQEFVAHKMSLYNEAVSQADKKILIGKYLSLGGVAVLGLDFFAGILFLYPGVVPASGSIISRDAVSAGLLITGYLGAAMIPAGFIVMGLGNSDKEHALEKLRITPAPFSSLTGRPVYGMKMEFRF